MSTFLCTFTQIEITGKFFGVGQNGPPSQNRVKKVRFMKVFGVKYLRYKQVSLYNVLLLPGVGDGVVIIGGNTPCTDTKPVNSMERSARKWKSNNGIIILKYLKKV